MNATIKFVLAALTLFTFISTPEWFWASELTLKDVRVRTYFSPGGGATKAVTKEISKAKREVLVLAYSLSSQAIVEALLDAHRRGLIVQIILDKSERGEGLTAAAQLINAGAPILLDGKHQLAHSNCMIIDRHTVITGSFNYTKAAEEKNSEDLLIIEAPQLAEEYRAFWESHRGHSEPY